MSEKVIAIAENGMAVTQSMIDDWCAAYDSGHLPSGYKYDGDVRRGRPRLFSDGTATVVVRVPAAQKEALGREAKERGLTMSCYVREILSKRESALA